MILTPGQPIPYGRPYRYHPNGLVHMMTARKRVGPLPIQYLDVGHPIDHSSSDYFSLDDSARDSSSDSSSKASSNFHSDASSDSSSRHSLSDHSSPDLPSTSAGHLARDRVKDSGYLAYIDVDPKETSLRDDVMVKGSDEPYLEQDIDPEIQAEIDEYIAYADALRDRGIDTRVVVEALNREESETGTRGLVEVRVKRVTHLAMLEDTTEPAQEERAVECTYETLGSLVQRFHDHIVANLVHRVHVIEGVRRKQGPEEMEAREAAMNLEPMNENEDEQEGENGGNGNGNGENGENGNGNRENGNGGRNQNGNKNGNHGMDYGGTLQGSALTWWNSYKRTIGVDAAYAMKWAGLMKLMTEVMLLDEEDTIERFIRGLPDNIQGNIIAAEPTKFQDAICIANNLMDQKLKGYTKRGQNVARAYTAGNNERKGYVGSLPYYKKYRLHLEGSCTVRCRNCKRVGHQTRDCRSTAAAPNTQRAAAGNQLGIVCYETRKLIIGMDWMAKNHVVIACDEKVVRISYGDKVLIIQRDDIDGRRTVAYRLKILEQLSRVHSMFHVSNLKKSLADEPLAIPSDEIQIDENLHFIEEPVEIIDREIMDREVKRLKQSRIPIVKVRWNSRRGPEFTWEREDQMQKMKPNGKLIYNSIMNGPYVRRMIPEPGDQNREVPVAKTFHEQTDEELNEKEVKQIEADDQAIQTICMGLPEEIYAAIGSCEITQEI
nr:putative reverse transcriptase domain-containing protein [Tanacetum cinerariifolium]